MYLDLDESDKEIYHFDIMDKQVYQYCNETKEFIQVDSVPAPHGRWTGIGTRRATEEDLRAFEAKFI